MTAESDSLSRIERKRARNHDALVAAARRLFTRYGVESATIAQITEEADLGFGTFYRYFEDKESVLRAVLDEAVLEFDAVVLADDDPAICAQDSLTRLVEGFETVGRRNRDVLALWWQLSFRKKQAGHEDAPSGPTLPVKLGAAVYRIVSRGIASGEFTAPDALIATQFITSGLMFVLAPAPQDAPDAIVHGELTALILRSLGAPAPAHRTRRKSG